MGVPLDDDVVGGSEASESGKGDGEVDSVGVVSGVSAIILDGVCGVEISSDMVVSSAKGVPIGNTIGAGTTIEVGAVIELD